MHSQFMADRGYTPEPWPPTTAALLESLLISPDSARVGAPGPVLPSMWLLGDDRHNAELGAALASALEHEMLPRIESWFDPEGMVQALGAIQPSTFPGLVPSTRAVAMALLDVDEPGDRLANTLALLPPDDMVRQWIEGRLGERATGSSSP